MTLPKPNPLLFRPLFQISGSATAIDSLKEVASALSDGTIADPPYNLLFSYNTALGIP